MHKNLRLLVINTSLRISLTSTHNMLELCKWTFRLERPAKTRITLLIWAIWSVSTVLEEFIGPWLAIGSKIETAGLPGHAGASEFQPIRYARRVIFSQYASFFFSRNRKKSQNYRRTRNLRVFV